MHAFEGARGLVRISSRIDAMRMRHHQLHARWDLRPAAAAAVAAAAVVVATSVPSHAGRRAQIAAHAHLPHLAPNLEPDSRRSLPCTVPVPVLPARCSTSSPAPPPFLLTHPSLFLPSLPFVSNTNLLLPIMSKVTASGIIAGNISTQRVKLNNGVEIPQVALGVYKAPNDGSTENACKWAFDAGYRHIDSAARYMNEESVGRALAEWTQANNVPRSEIFITSKLWDADHDKAAAAVEDSLKKLQVEYMDMYLMHSPGTMGPEKRLEAWKALEEAVDAGKIKTIGVSNFDVEDLDHLLANCRIKPAVNQIESHPFFAHEELREACIERGIHIQAYSPMAQGQALDRPEIKAIATKHGKTPAQILLKWGLAHGNIILPKSLTKHRIESNAQLFDFQLDNDDMDALDGLDEGLKVGKLGPPGTSQPASPGGTRPGSRRSSGSGGLSGNKLQMSSS
ncbi:2,5-diketo-D-gluconic acid reductase A [Moesziomyces antarcticus]|uniref:2,5-diketo-D-gluconic acid reductase A n=1 Tax=Pseudozyma antarctica TaxID=84753 RepID=A0A081CN89_PSEA2|nr:2,5-diketo-D-gluconic acid reductase A [Moesziomyces antarcticus]GAK68135.1 2,5-diketo-D-gluconic acid reductase A [Moesziomyces antarcticus]